MNKSSQNLRVQVIITGIALILFLVKIAAWLMTNSVAILTDALESTVNVIAGFLGIYSLWVASKPRDAGHPYGHGKVEFISAAVEGALIGLAGILIIIEALRNLSKPHEITALDKGMILVGITAAVNFAAGTVCQYYGRKNNSLALIASGKHLKSDVYTTLGILLGLFLLFMTGIKWIDSAVAILFAGIILVTAYRIIRSSLAGIMDEADEELLRSLVTSLEANRKEDWIDLHNLRIIKYGGTLHLDMHLTVPWYFNVHEAHRVVDDISSLVRENFGESVELFIHTDGCLDFSCPLCTKNDCSRRKQEFVKRVPWTMENVVNNSKHRI